MFFPLLVLLLLKYLLSSKGEPTFLKLFFYDITYLHTYTDYWFRRNVNKIAILQPSIFTEIAKKTETHIITANLEG